MCKSLVLQIWLTNLSLFNLGFLQHMQLSAVQCSEATALSGMYLLLFTTQHVLLKIWLGHFGS